jgi:hypothetical protein
MLGRYTYKRMHGIKESTPYWYQNYNISQKLILGEYFKVKESLYTQVLIYQTETILNRIDSKMDLHMHKI